MLLSPQMVKLCWAHGLYDAIFYVYNRGMRDFTAPLEVSPLIVIFLLAFPLMIQMFLLSF